MRSTGEHLTVADLDSWMSVLIACVQSGRTDLTNRQMALLMLVHLTPGPHTVRGLAARLKVSKPVVTRALNTLGGLGYLERRKDERDLRNVLVEGTKHGEAFLKSFAALIEKGIATKHVEAPARPRSPA